MGGKRAGKPSRNDVLSQLETQEVPEDRQEDAASGALVKNDGTTLTGGEASGAPGDVLRQLRGVGRVKLDVKRKIPGNAWWRNKVIKENKREQSTSEWAELRTSDLLLHLLPWIQPVLQKENHC